MYIGCFSMTHAYKHIKPMHVDYCTYTRDHPCKLYRCMRRANKNWLPHLSHFLQIIANAYARKAHTIG